MSLTNLAVVDIITKIMFTERVGCKGRFGVRCVKFLHNYYQLKYASCIKWRPPFFFFFEIIILKALVFVKEILDFPDIFHG